MTLLDEIRLKCTESEIESKEHGLIAEKISLGRTKPNDFEIGNGVILETLGFEKGNMVLELIYSTETFKYVHPLLQQGRLRASSRLLQETCENFVLQGVLTRQEADAIKSLGFSPAPVSVYEVIDAMKGI